MLTVSCLVKEKNKFPYSLSMKKIVQVSPQWKVMIVSNHGVRHVF